MADIKFLDFSKKTTNTITISDSESLKRTQEMGLTYDILSRPFIDAYNIKKWKPIYAMPMEVNLTPLFEAVKLFRKPLLEEGWSYKDKMNFNQTISPNGRIIITISSGDAYTGRSSSKSKTKNKKGKVAENVVEMNNYIQLNLNIPNFLKYKIKYNPTSALNWFLLFHYNNNRIQLELSLPRLYDKKTGKVIDWYERILLPDIDLNDIAIPNDTSNDGPEFKPLCDNNIDEIEITKK